MLRVFWESHDPAHEVWSRQYRNAVFALDAAQREQAERSRQAVATRLGDDVATAIEPAGTFYPAEDYHQKYLLRKAEGLLQELQAAYPDPKQLAASTAAARLNGYLGCNGEPAQLAREIGELGLSPPMQQRLIDYVNSSCDRFAGLTCPAPQ